MELKVYAALWRCCPSLTHFKFTTNVIWWVFFFSFPDLSAVLMAITTIFYPFRRKTYWKYFHRGLYFLFFLKRKEIKTWNLGWPISFFRDAAVIQREMCQFDNIFRRYLNLELEQKFRSSSMTLTVLTVFFCANALFDRQYTLIPPLHWIADASAIIAMVALGNLASENQP